MESDIIKISHLNKSFGEVKAVNDLSFRVKKGELFAFLGVNGAGKSTTISILCGLLKKDSGTVQVNGIETDKAGAQTKRMLGVVFQDSVLDKPLTVKENLNDAELQEVREFIRGCGQEKREANRQYSYITYLHSKLTDYDKLRSRALEMNGYIKGMNFGIKMIDEKRSTDEYYCVK